MTQAITQISESISTKAERAIQSIMTAMRQYAVTTAGVSYGKDSSCILALTLEASRRLKTEGVDKPVILLTADTGVENPSMIKLARRMSEAALNFANQNNLNVEQRWVKPAAMDNHLVGIIGGQRTASVPGQQATCTVNLKITPMDRVRRELADQHGAQNILTLIGTRFAESETRGRAMKSRSESATLPQVQDNGSALLSPIADWSLGDVWALLNGSERQTGFETLDFTPTLVVYETFGESTCSIGAIDPNFKKQTSGGCGSAGRTGCWACNRVQRDSSLESMLDSMPAYEPLVRLSKTIRAGHYLPENRSYLGRTLKDGQIQVFANGYGPQWTEQLLAWALSIDADEDDRAVRTGKERRFPKILPEEHLVLIAFQWARYGHHAPGAFIRIYSDIVVGGRRHTLPTDAELEDMTARANTSRVGESLGYLTVDNTDAKPAFRDTWRDMLGNESACATPVMQSHPTRYKARSGTQHDSLRYADGLQANLSDLTDPDGKLNILFHDWMWWYEMTFADGSKSNAEEAAWLLREGIIEARRGYQSRIAEYQQYSRALEALGLTNATLDTIRQHPAFTAVTDLSEQQALFFEAA